MEKDIIELEAKVEHLTALIMLLMRRLGFEQDEVTDLVEKAIQVAAEAVRSDDDS
jgi:hypothetical protein